MMFVISEELSFGFYLCTEYFASSAMKHLSALLQTSNVQQCVFIWTAVASSMVSHELHSCLMFNLL